MIVSYKHKCTFHDLSQFIYDNTNIGSVNSTAYRVNRKATNSRTLAIEESHGNCVVCENSREISWQVSRER